MPRQREDAPFNNPFRDPSTRKRLAHALVPPEKPPAARVARRPSSSTLTSQEEALLWAEATRGAVPLHTLHVAATSSPARFNHGGFVDPDDAAFRTLVEFVRGAGAFELWDQDEFIEGTPGTQDPRVLAALRAGELSVQGYVDLHGLVVDEARAQLADFFRSARQCGLRCVLVVHGRGLHSKDGVAVLKERLTTWLTHGRLARQVLAWCTARRHDGGAGALYVLLRTSGELRNAPRRRQRGRAGNGGPRRSGASQGSSR